MLFQGKRSNKVR